MIGDIMHPGLINIVIDMASIIEKVLFMDRKGV